MGRGAWCHGTTTGFGFVMKRTFLIWASVVLATGQVWAWPPPRLPKDRIPDDMPAELRRQLEILYDHAPNHGKCIAACKAIGDMGAKAAPAAPFLASCLYAPNSRSTGHYSGALVRIAKAMTDPTPVIESVVIAVGMGDSRGRTRALGILHALNAKQAVPAMVDSLAAGRGFRFDGRGALRDLGVYDYIDRLLVDERPASRLTAVRAMHVAGSSEWRVPNYLRALKDEDSRIRDAAIDGLARLCNPRSRGEVAVDLSDEMLAALESEDAATRRSAVVLVSAARGDEARKMKALLPLVADPDQGVQLAVVNSLGTSGGAEVVAALGRHVAHPNDITRSAVAKALGRTKNKEAVSFLEMLLKDGSPLVRESALQSMADVIGQPFAERIGRVLNRDSDGMVMRRAMLILGGWRDAKNLGDLGRFLKHEDESVGTAAIDAAVALGTEAQGVLIAAMKHESPRLQDYAAMKLRKDFKPNPEHVKALLALVPNPDLATRKNALAILAGSGSEVPDTAKVRAALDDPDAWVLAYALQVLRNNKDYKALDKARRIVAKGGSGVAAKAAFELMLDAGDIKGIAAARGRGTKGIGRMAIGYLQKMDRKKVEAVLGPGALKESAAKKAKETPETLVKQLLEVRGDPRRRMPVEEKLLAMGGRGIKALGALLESESPGIRAVGVDALARSKRPEASALVLGAIADPVVGVRCRVALAAGGMSHTGAVHVTRAALGSDDWCVRESAVRGLGGRKDAGAQDLIRGSLKDAHWCVRAAALEMLTALDAEKAVDDLIGALEDEHWFVVHVAADALKKTTRQDLGSDAAKWRAWRGKK